jgi:hypothetical protein
MFDFDYLATIQVDFKAEVQKYVNDNDVRDPRKRSSMTG